MIAAKSSVDFKTFISVFIASVKSGKRYDFRGHQDVILPERFLSPSPESNIYEVASVDYTPTYKVPYSDTMLYKTGTTVRTADFFMDLQYVILKGKEVETVYYEWLVRLKPYSILNARLKHFTSPPVITRQPENMLVPVREPFTLTVQVENATSFQWKRNGSNVAGASNQQTLTISKSAVGHSGEYTVVCTNEAGSVESEIAVINVLPTESPTNPLPVITVQPESQTVTEGDSFRLSVKADNVTSYQWKRNRVDIEGISNKDSIYFDKMLPFREGNYTVTCTNSAGTITSHVAVIKCKLIDTPPVIKEQPTDKTVNVGDRLVINLNVAGAREYQWYFNDQTIPSQTGGILVIDVVKGEDAGEYKVECMNDYGSTFSNTVNVTVTNN